MNTVLAKPETIILFLASAVKQAGGTLRVSQTDLDDVAFTVLEEFQGVEEGIAYVEFKLKEGVPMQ